MKTMFTFIAKLLGIDEPVGLYNQVAMVCEANSLALSLYKVQMSSNRGNSHRLCNVGKASGNVATRTIDNGGDGSLNFA